MRNRIAGRVAPALEMLAVAFTNSMREGGLLRRVSNALERAVIFLANGINVVVDNMGSLIRVFAVFVGAKIAIAIVSIGSAMIGLARVIRTTGLVMMAFNKIAKAKITTLALVAAVIAELTGTMDTMVGFIRRTGEAINNALPESMSDGIENLSDAIIGLGDDIDAIDSRQATIFTGAMAGAALATDSLNDAVGRIPATSASTASALTDLTDIAEDRFSSLRSSMESSMESGFMSIIDGTMRAKDAFKSMARDIIKELYRVLVVQRIVAGISGAFQTAFPSLAGPQTAANGTSYAQGGMTLVGERGPELVNMPRGSQVIDARRTASRMGNGDIVQNFSFNLSANGDESVRRIVSQAAPQIVEAAKAGVADAVRRGGSYGRAFA